MLIFTAYLDVIGIEFVEYLKVFFEAFANLSLGDGGVKHVLRSLAPGVGID
jgi:hypothetical protein